MSWTNFSYGELVVVHHEARIISINGEEIWFGKRQYMVLLRLMSALGSPVHCDLLVKGLAVHGVSNQIRLEVFRLRKRLEKFSIYIKSTGEGYYRLQLGADHFICRVCVVDIKYDNSASSSVGRAQSLYLCGPWFESKLAD